MNQKDNLKQIPDDLPSNQEIAEDILSLVKNETTRISCDSDITKNYYVFLNDTMYLSSKEEYQQDFNRVCVIAHEAVHSKQPKLLQLANFLFSQLEWISFILVIVLYLYNMTSSYLLFGYLAIVMVNIILRSILEIQAVIKSVPLAKQYLALKLPQEQVTIIINSYQEKVKKLLPFFVISLFLARILRMITIVIIYAMK